MPPTLKSAYRRCTPRKCPSKRLRNQCRISGCIIQNLNFRLSLNVQGLYPASISNVILGVNPTLKTCIEGRGSPIKRIRLDFQQGKSRLRFGRWFLGSGPASRYDSQTQRNTEYIPLHPFVFYLPVYIRRTAAAAVDTHSCSHTCSTIQAHKLAVNRSKSDVTDPFALA